ncbi:MAG: hypothetical protein ACOX2F_11860 [bacterium]
MDCSKFDLRTLERKFNSGEITEKEYNKFLELLNDSDEYVELDEEQLIKDAGIKKQKNKLPAGD